MKNKVFVSFFFVIHCLCASENARNSALDNAEDDWVVVSVENLYGDPEEEKIEMLKTDERNFSSSSVTILKSQLLAPKIDSEKTPKAQMSHSYDNNTEPEIRCEIGSVLREVVGLFSMCFGVEEDQSFKGD